MFPLEWENIWIVDFDATVAAGQELTERREPACLQVWERGMTLHEDRVRDPCLELGPGKGNPCQSTGMSAASPIFQEKQCLARALFAVGVVETRTGQARRSVDNFVFGFAAISASGNHFTHNFGM